MSLIRSSLGDLIIKSFNFLSYIKKKLSHCRWPCLQALWPRRQYLSWFPGPLILRVVLNPLPWWPWNLMCRSYCHPTISFLCILGNVDFCIGLYLLHKENAFFLNEGQELYLFVCSRMDIRIQLAFLLV